MKKELILRTFSSIILIPLVFYIILQGSYLFNILLIIVILISILEWSKLGKNLFIKIIGVIFLIISFLTIFKLRHHSSHEYLEIFFILTICISTDVGGYVFGNLFKGPKLTKISPNKTYSGVLGSFLFALVLIYFFSEFFNFQNFIKNNYQLYFIVILLSAISQIGDLIVSYFKRINNVKDTGKIIPGHGGILDRIDGMIFCFPFYYFLFYLNLTKF